MTAVEFKREERIIKRAAVALKNDPKKARRLFVKIGLLKKNGQFKRFAKTG